MFIFDLTLATRRAALTGVERYGVRLFEAMRKRAPQTIAFAHDLSAFSSRDGVIEVSRPYRDWALLPMLIWAQGLSPEAVIAPSAPPSPLFASAATPLCRVVHDAFPWTRPQSGSRLGRLLFRDVEMLMARRYDLLFGTTAPVAEDLGPLFNRTDIGVSGNAPGLDLAALAALRGDAQETADACGAPVAGLAPGFTLAVGTIEPRKDYPRLIRLARAAPEGAPPLVIVGRRGWGPVVDELEAARRETPTRLIWLDELTQDDQLAWLYRHAGCFVSLSLAEGFNMPLVEAGVAGRPILCSDLPIHRAVAPAWARFVDHTLAPETLWATVAESEPPPQDAVAAYGERFSWDGVARTMLERLERQPRALRKGALLARAFLPKARVS